MSGGRCRSITAFQFAVFDVVEYLRPHFIAFANDDRVKKSFDAIRQHRRQVTTKHDFLPSRTKPLRYIDAALELHDLARERNHIRIAVEVDVFQILFS